MKTHELKTDRDVFISLAAGMKKFEIRYDDRGFEIFDILHLRETVHTGEEMKNGKPLIYTGREVYTQICYILKGPIYGLKEGWAILSIDKIIGN